MLPDKISLVEKIGNLFHLCSHIVYEYAQGICSDDLAVIMHEVLSHLKYTYMVE